MNLNEANIHYRKDTTDKENRQTRFLRNKQFIFIKIIVKFFASPKKYILLEYAIPFADKYQEIASLILIVYCPTLPELDITKKYGKLIFNNKKI